METPTSTKFENKNKMADSHFAIPNQSDVEQLKKIIIKINKSKYFESNTELVESLAEFGAKRESRTEN